MKISKISIISKISLIIFLISMTASVAEISGILNKTLGYYIFAIGMLIQILLGVIIGAVFLIRKNHLKRGIKIIRYKIMDKHIKGGTDLVPSYISTTNPIKSSIFRIFIEANNFEKLPDLGIYMMKKGDINVDINKHLIRFRSGIGENLYIFDADLVVNPDEKINCKFKDDINIKTFFIGELYIP